MTSPEDHAMTYFGERGFEYWPTGGNCTAFAKHLDDGKHYVLITDEDCTAPIAGKVIIVGLYNDDNLVNGVHETAASFDEAVTKLNALIEQHVK